MRILLLTGLVLFAGIAQGATSAQRSLFLDTLAAAEQGRLADESAARRQLQDYPLYDYLTAADLRYRLRVSPARALDQRIQAFITEHPDLPPAQRLRSPWLASLARRGRWQTLLDNSNDDDGTRTQCRIVHARTVLGDNPRADALALWRVGHSQPDACDPVFAWLENRGLLTADEIQRRARLALLDGQYGLVRYLSGKLPDTRAATLDDWLAIAQNPSRLRSRRNLDGDIAVHAFKRLARSDLDSAAVLMPALVERLGLDAAQHYQMQRFVALLYAQNHEPEALAWFARIDHARMADDEHALGWEIRAAIYQQRWPLVVQAIRNLPADIAADEEWQYWLARGLAESGNEDQAQPIYARLARERSYHGYLASDALGQDYSLNERPLADDDAARARVTARPALARARELRTLGMTYRANREWNQVIAGQDKPALAAAARIAHEWQWHSRAITTLAQSDYWDDLDIRYPLPYADAVRNAADRNGLTPAYVFAIMRTESLFQPGIRSSAGAVGLMQLLPGTARHVARNMGSGAPSPSRLDVPSVNIRLGSHYLRSMLARWGGNLAMATASYNAGPNRIARWLPAETMEPAIWIANIPYTETRNYVQRAMSHMTVFQDRLDGDIEPLDKRLDPVRPSYTNS